ncbi:MAG: glycosyltransferase [Planctomycetes bacterium]|nr:glycosyltransferase [Planctomycetota bacterium]
METPHGPQPSYEECTRLAAAGRLDEALAGLRAYIEDHPDDGQALNDAGTVLFALGRAEESVGYLERAAARLTEGRGQALWNLAEAYLAARRPAEVVALFDDLAGDALLTPDLANRTATQCLDAGDAAAAMEALLCSLRLQDNQEVLKPACEVIRSKRPKVAFLCEFDDTKFVRDIARHIGERFETRFAKGQSTDETRQLLQWCDIAWLEWCTPQVILASQMPRTFRSIVRLHRFEAYKVWPPQVAWEHIDVLVTVGNPVVVAHLKQTVPDLQRRTRLVTIPSAVDLAAWPFRERPRGKHIACLGYLNPRKNVSLLLQCFARLHAIDPEYRLFIGGTSQDSMLTQYVETMIGELGLAASISMDGWQHDPAAWFADKHYVVSTSLGEGFPVSLLEGMACGLKPVVHTWPGVRDIFPGEWLFRTVDEFCDRVISDPYEPQAYRAFAERYSLAAQLRQVNGLFLEFERNPCPKPPASPPPAARPRGDDAGTSMDAFLDQATASSRQGT